MSKYWNIMPNDDTINDIINDTISYGESEIDFYYAVKGCVVVASSKEYLDFILEQLSELNDITYRTMMGEYIIYYQGKIVGGIYDDRFLVKPVNSAIKLMPNAEYELPYEGTKKMLLVDNVDNKEFLIKLFNSMYKELPASKEKRITTSK